MALLIVESPTKARTFNRYISADKFDVVSSMGHVRDLPKKKLGIDVNSGFEPTYEILKGKNKLVSELIKKAKREKEVILATDPDREGEAIAYHLKQLILQKAKNIKFKRIVFHEITKEALMNALKESRDIDVNLFDAQQARRILDRLVGYKISPYLWKRFSKNWLSAGRVQTVALRFIVERQKERDKFSSSVFYTFNSVFAINDIKLNCELVLLKGKSFFTTNKVVLFDGEYTYKQTIIQNKKTAEDEFDRLKKETYFVSLIKESKSKRSPQPPFTTSTLQQYASSKFGFSAKKTMRVAQSLYENGYISYHRTDSMTLSKDFIKRARQYIVQAFGEKYLNDSVRVYKTKLKVAQEAHEAIRPTDVTAIPNKSLASINADGLKLYEAIYKRSIATQMSDAKVTKQKIEIRSSSDDVFYAESERIDFLGFLQIYNMQNNKGELYSIQKSDIPALMHLDIDEKITNPPPLYSEASLIKTLEKRGIGRPSTYAPIVSLIQERQYVKKQGRSLAPTELGIKITEVLSSAFDNVFEVIFTAKMEDELDYIASGTKKWKSMISEFYLSLESQLKKAYEITEKVRIEEKTNEICPECSKPLVIKISRFGKFYACTGFPDCRYTKPYIEKTGVICPECNKGELVIRFSKKRRRFYGCEHYPKCKYTSLYLKNKPNKDKNTSQPQKN